MSDVKPQYICVLDSGCDRGEHSLSCKAKNVTYANAWRKRKRERRLAMMDAVIEGRDDEPGDDA